MFLKFFYIYFLNKFKNRIETKDKNEIIKNYYKSLYLFYFIIHITMKNKQIDSEYTSQLDEAKKFLEDKDSRSLHINAPFGQGKSTFVNTLKKEAKHYKNRIIILDEFLYSKRDVDNVVFIDNNSNFKKREKRNKVYRTSKKIFWSLLIIIFSLVLGFIPIFNDSSFATIIKVIPAFLLIPIIGSFLIGWVFKPRENNRKIYVIENIDRINWDITMYLFMRMYEWTNNSRKTNKVIYTYSIENLKTRYKEKYGDVPNLKLLIDKFMDVEISLKK